MAAQFEAYETFCRKFQTEEACVEALYKSRWPDGFQCTKCQSDSFYLIRTRRLPLYECKNCRHQTSIIAGTIMEGSSTLLTRWFQAIFLLSQPSGISAMRLSKLLQITYKTAWLIAHKIRHAMEHADSKYLLSGSVRIDQIYYGYLCFQDARQPLLIGATLDNLQQPQAVKIKCPHPEHVFKHRRRIDRNGIHDFIRRHLDPNTIPTAQNGPTHPPLNKLQWNMTHWLNDTFQGIGAKHLQAYMDEFCFRLNLNMRGASIIDALMHWCTHTSPLIYRDLIRNKPVLPVPWTAWGSKAKWKGWHLTRWYA